MAIREIGVPGGIQELYATYGGANYNTETKKYTLDFRGLPDDMTYCSEPKTYASECNEPMAGFGTGNLTGTKWTYNAMAQKCEEFVFSGEGGNGNNYESQALCASACETPIPMTAGGQIFFQTETGECMLPPTKVDGEPCCTMKMWQPNYAGFYYDNCCAQRPLGGDGLYYFKTELPGSEESAKWGPDPMPHIHYDIECNECAPNAVFSGAYRYWNKFYPEDICTLPKCYGKRNIHKIAGPHHKAEKEVIDGENMYRYNMLLPAAGA